MATVGTVIGGRFRIDQFLGFGGMGLVVAATHLELGHRVALKFLRDEMAANPTVVERFLREARSVVQLRTEHVCRVFDVGRTDAGAPYIVMELLEGSDLGRVVARQPLPVTLAVEYVMQACVALAEAHAAGIVHRDLKPANLFVTRRPGGGPLIKVLDFGIAKAAEAGAQLTQSHSMLGSPAYISPEQLQSARDVDARTDIWALGATLYQLLSARLPFYRPNATEMAVRIMTEAPDPLEVDPVLRTAVLRCLEKSPAQRYPGVAALVADLAPFGGPSGRAIAALVGKLAGGAIAAPAPAPAPVVSPLAATAAASVASVARGATAAASVAGTARGATAAASVASAAVAPPAAMPAPAARVAEDAPAGVEPGAAPTRGRRRWWIAAPLVVIASAAAALIHGRQGATPSPIQGSATVVAAAAGPATPAAPAAAAMPAPAPATAPADAGLEQARISVRPADPAPKTTRAKDGRSRTVRARASQPTASPPPSGNAAAPTAPAAPTGGTQDAGKHPTITRTVAETAREAKNTCLESTADTPWNTAMCWCTKKDRPRAQAAFARLSGFKRATVREYCAVRGVDL